MTITTAQIRGARGILNWSQQDLAQRTGISATSIGAIENGQTTPRESTLEKIKSTLEDFEIEFIEGGIRKRQKMLQVIEGDDCYVKVLDLAYLTLSKSNGKKEILFSGADERRSPTYIIEKFRFLLRNNIQMRSLIKSNDTYIMGNLENYRWLTDDLFLDTDVKVIFDNYVVYFMSWKEIKKAIVINDENIANENRRTFEYIWEKSPAPTKTTATVKYE